MKLPIPLYHWYLLVYLINSTKCNLKNLCNENENFQLFENTFFSIILTLIDDFTLNSDNNIEIWSFGLCWPFLAFIDLHWPFWPLWPWIIFLSKKWPLLIKIKYNWHVSNNQMSKPISERVSATWITVTLRNELQTRC